MDDDRQAIDTTDTEPRFSSGVVKEYRKPTGHPGRKTATYAAQGVGLAAQGGGAVIDATGRGVRGVSRAAAAIPVVGAPIAVAGTAAGTGMSATGKGVKRAGRVINRTGRMSRRDIKQQERRGERRVGASPLTQPPTRLPSVTDIPILGGMISKHRAKQRSLMFRIASLGIAIIVAILNGLMVAAFGGGAVASIFGAPETAVGLIAIFWFFSALIPAQFLLIALGMMKKVANPHGAMKELMFMGAFIMCFVPFANVFPWSWWWLKRLGNHPE